MTVSRASIIIWARDIAGIAGVASISYGAWLTYAPAGFLVGGVLLLGGAIAVARGGL